MVVLSILDGFGLRDCEYGNAIALANTPNFDSLWEKYPHCKLLASEESVGLPAGQMGNSEVGHMNIGAGRIVYQAQERINESIRCGDFFQNKEILKVIEQVKKNDSKLHLLGLVSDGGVHSHLNHLLALLDLCKMHHVPKVYLHLFTDGRDVDPRSAYAYLSKVEEKLQEIQLGVIATISGRYYAMDRDNNYDRLKLAYDAIVYGVGPKEEDIFSFLTKNYENGVTDEFLIPTIFDESGTIEDGDGVVTFNYRKDRLRELFTALTNSNFSEIPVRQFSHLHVLTMMPVVESVQAPYAFDDMNLSSIFGEYIASLGMSQLRIAETEKYAHVTFFFDGGKEVDFPKEKKILIPSPKVATYDLKPEMSIDEVTDTLLKELEMTSYDFVILNYANCDMVGHTGNLSAAIKAVEAVDKNLGRLYQKVQELGGILVVTADHGNADMMLDEDAHVITSHTTSPVPLIICNPSYSLRDGKLGDIAPTLLSLVHVPIPDAMTGECLITQSKEI